jgi:hypothetical protein
MDDTSKACHSGFGTTPIALFGDAARRFNNGRERDLDLLARNLCSSA